MGKNIYRIHSTMDWWGKRELEMEEKKRGKNKKKEDEFSWIWCAWIWIFQTIEANVFIQQLELSCPPSIHPSYAYMWSKASVQIDFSHSTYAIIPPILYIHIPPSPLNIDFFSLFFFQFFTILLPTFYPFLLHTLLFTTRTTQSHVFKEFKNMWEVKLVCFWLEKLFKFISIKEILLLLLKWVLSFFLKKNSISNIRKLKVRLKSKRETSTLKLNGDLIWSSKSKAKRNIKKKIEITLFRDLRVFHSDFHFHRKKPTFFFSFFSSSLLNLKF